MSENEDSHLYSMPFSEFEGLTQAELDTALDNAPIQIEPETRARFIQALQGFVRRRDTHYPPKGSADEVIITEHNGAEDEWGRTPRVDLRNTTDDWTPGTTLILRRANRPFRPLQPGLRWAEVYGQTSDTFNADGHQTGYKKQAPLDPAEIDDAKLQFELHTVDTSVSYTNPDPKNPEEWRKLVLPEGDFVETPVNSKDNYSGGAITGMRARNLGGDVRVFRFDEHVERFARDLSALNFPGMTREMLEEGFRTQLRLNRRWVPGAGSDNFFYVRGLAMPDNIALRISGLFRRIHFLGSPVSGAYMPEMVDAVLAGHERAVPRGLGAVKATTNYIGAYLARERENDGNSWFQEIIFEDENTLQEGLSANIALIFHGKGDNKGKDLILIPDHPEVLPSIMSKSAIELLRAQGHTVRKQKVNRTMFKQANEAMFLGTAAMAMGMRTVHAPGRLVDGHMQKGELLFEQTNGEMGHITEFTRNGFYSIFNGDEASMKELNIEASFIEWMQRAE